MIEVRLMEDLQEHTSKATDYRVGNVRKNRFAMKLPQHCEVIDLTIDEPEVLDSTIKAEHASVYPVVHSPVSSPVPSTSSVKFPLELSSASIPTPPSASPSVKAERALSDPITVMTPCPSSSPTPNRMTEASRLLSGPQAASLSLESRLLYRMKDNTYWDTVNSRFIKFSDDIPAPVKRENLNEFLHFLAEWFDVVFIDKSFGRSAFQRRINQGLATTLRAIIVQKGIQFIDKLQLREIWQIDAQDKEDTLARLRQLITPASIQAFLSPVSSSVNLRKTTTQDKIGSVRDHMIDLVVTTLQLSYIFWRQQDKQRFSHGLIGETVVTTIPDANRRWKSEVSMSCIEKCLEIKHIEIMKHFGMRTRSKGAIDSAIFSIQKMKGRENELDDEYSI
ncbi:hypothetical protein BELL_1259g00010 [Botrytis elliptica]|uniref:Uncharacterized protein n=1 Tax=Botrytis elliptica TaxID=278938 RepID=A0A4Z1ICK3_9HELO|nr:hypothetical protein BELL_1259g00010 [Botrytis elliptica]